MISIDGIQYLAHRLAWLYTHGEWPDDEIDHADGDRSNSRLSNLRVADFEQQSHNIKIPATNKTGFLGVKHHTSRWYVGGTLQTKENFRADIVTGGKRVFLGLFSTAEEAGAAHAVAAHHYRGEFVRASAVPVIARRASEQQQQLPLVDAPATVPSESLDHEPV